MSGEIQRDSDVEDEAETEEVHEARASRVELCLSYA